MKKSKKRELKSRSSAARTKESPSTTASKAPQKPLEPIVSLLDLLKHKYPDTSVANLRQWLKFKRIVVDGKIVVDPRQEVDKNVKLQVLKKNEPLADDVKVLYSDHDLIVVDKPDKILSVASDSQKHSIHQIIKLQFYPKRVGVIHRLDEGTSGVMIFTFSDPAYQGLKAQFKEHSIERVYIGLVEGEFPKQEGTWVDYLYEDDALKMRITDDPVKGEKAITHFEKLEVGNGLTLVRFKLETGKKNQIRVQTAASGYPIVGDKKYGSTINPINRLGLHAETLSFIHPVTKKRMTFQSKAPKKFYTAIK